MSALNPSAVCQTCAKFVCNAMTIHSQCGLCECDFATEKIEIPDDQSETEFETDCCLFRHIN